MNHSLTGTIEGDNRVIGELNESILELARSLDEKTSELSTTSYIKDFENFTIDLYFSNNKKKASVSVENEEIVLSFEEKTIRIDSHGNIIQ